MAATDPLLLVNAVADKASDRKLRLLLVACCRRIWPLLQHQALQEAVEAAEAFVEGMATVEELASSASAVNDLLQALRSSRQAESSYVAVHAVLMACSEPGHLGSRLHSFVGRYINWSYCVMQGLDAAANATALWLKTMPKVSDVSDQLAIEHRRQCFLVRDIFGNPFRPVTITPDCLVWNDGTIPKIAQAIYVERAFDRLPILADAIEESGLNDLDILAHCRQSGEHTRGCWVVDLILNKP